MTTAVFADIAAEHARNRARWGDPQHPFVHPRLVALAESDPDTGRKGLPAFYDILSEKDAKRRVETARCMGRLDMVVLIAEEFTEAISAPTEAEARGELIQTAALIVETIEGIDLRAGGMPGDAVPSTPADTALREAALASGATGWRVTPDGYTLLPENMRRDLGMLAGGRLWFLRGKDAWEAWPEDLLSEALGNREGVTGTPPPSVASTPAVEPTPAAVPFAVLMRSLSEEDLCEHITRIATRFGYDPTFPLTTTKRDGSWIARVGDDTTRMYAVISMPHELPHTRRTVLILLLSVLAENAERLVQNLSAALAALPAGAAPAAGSNACDPVTPIAVEPTIRSMVHATIPALPQGLRLLDGPLLVTVLLWSDGRLEATLPAARLHATGETMASAVAALGQEIAASVTHLAGLRARGVPFAGAAAETWAALAGLVDVIAASAPPVPTVASGITGAWLTSTYAGLEASGIEEPDVLVTGRPVPRAEVPAVDLDGIAARMEAAVASPRWDASTEERMGVTRAEVRTLLAERGRTRAVVEAARAVVRSPRESSLEALDSALDAVAQP